MTTFSEFTEAIVDRKLHEKLLAVLIREYPRVQRADLEDVAQRTLVELARRLHEISGVSIEYAAYERAKLRVIDWLTREAERRRARSGMSRGRARGYDPHRHIDFKIDLGRTIEQCVQGDMQAVVAKVIVGGWDVTELVPQAAVRRAQRAVQATRKMMRRKGYKSLRAS